MTFVLSGSVITQSGTDANPSGLGAIAGVTTQSFGTGSRIRTIYTIPAGRQLAITGTLTHDTDQYLILFSDNSANTGALTKVLITGVYNYGIKANGQPSSLSGISIPTDPGTWWAPAIVASGTNGNAILVTGSAARFNMQGGQIDGALTIGYGNSAGGTISGGTVVVRDDGITNGTNWLTRILTPSIAFNNYTMIGGSLSIGANTAGQTFSISRPGAGGVAYWLQTQSATATRVKDYVVGAGYDVGIAPYSDGVGGVNCVPTISQNSAAGTAVNLRGGEPAPSGDIANAGYHAFLRTISTSITTESGLADGVLYIKDTNNGQRKNLNSIDDTPDKIYIGTITSGALSAWSKIGGGGLVYANNYEVISGIVNVVRNATNTRGTSNVGIWRKDLRGLSDVEGEDRFNFHVWSYANQYKVINQSLAGAGTLVLAEKVLADSGVTLSNASALTKLASSFTVNTSTNTITVTANSTLSDLYDAMKAYKCQAVQSNLEYPTIGTQLVNAVGPTLSTAMTVVVSSGVTLSTSAKFNQLTASVTNNGTLSSGLTITGNVTQATPTNLTGVNITGNLTFNTNTGVTVTFTDCEVSGTSSNSGTGIVKVVKAGTTPWLTAGTNVNVIAYAIIRTDDDLALSTYVVKNGATDLGWVVQDTDRTLEVTETDTFSIYLIAYGYKAKLISADASDLTTFKTSLIPEPYIDTTLSTTTRDFIASKFSVSLDAYFRVSLALDTDLRNYTPEDVMNAIQYFLVTQGELIAQGVIYGGTIDGVSIVQGGISIGTPGFYGQVKNTVTTTNDLGILIPIYIEVLPSVYVADPTYTPVKKNTSGITLQTSPWTKQTASISASDRTVLAITTSIATWSSTEGSKVVNNTGLIPGLL